MRKALRKRAYQYTAIFEPQEEGGYAVTPALPGCISLKVIPLKRL